MWKASGRPGRREGRAFDAPNGFVTTRGAAVPPKGNGGACLASRAFDLQRRHSAQTAFWLNVFNAVVLRARPSLRRWAARAASAFFEARASRAGPFEYSSTIEHTAARQPAQSARGARCSARRSAPRRPLAYDERMHFAMFSVSRSSPTLDAFGAGRLDAELEDAAARYLQRHVRVENEGAVVVLPHQFQWYAADFGGERNALTFALARLDDQVVDLVDQRRGRVRVRYAEFDWRPNVRG
jgi:hypothetical protein